MMDISYCTYNGCRNEACPRNAVHVPTGEQVSFSVFTDCDYYKKFLIELAKQEEKEAIEEARREAYRLDDDEDTLQYRHGF